MEVAGGIIRRSRERARTGSGVVADLAIYLFELADNLKIDLPRAVQAKLTKNGQKYPAEQVRGSSKKYSEYSQKAADAK